MSTELARNGHPSGMEVICNQMIKLGFEYPMERHLPGTFLKTFLEPLEERLKNDYIIMGQQNPLPIILHQTPDLEELNAFWNTLRLCHAPFIEKKVNGRRVLDVENVKRELYLLSYYICKEDNTLVFMTEKLKDGERENANLIGLQWVLWWTPRVVATEKCAPRLIRQMLVELVMTDKIQDENASKIYIVAYYVGRPLVMALPVEAQHCYRDADNEPTQAACDAAILYPAKLNNSELRRYYRVSIKKPLRRGIDATFPPLVKVDYSESPELYYRFANAQLRLQGRKAALQSNVGKGLSSEATDRGNVLTQPNQATQPSETTVRRSAAIVCKIAATERSNAATERSNEVALRDNAGQKPEQRTFLKTLLIPVKLYISLFRGSSDYGKNRPICVNGKEYFLRYCASCGTTRVVTMEDGKDRKVATLPCGIRRNATATAFRRSRLIAEEGLQRAFSAEAVLIPNALDRRKQVFGISAVESNRLARKLVK